MKKLLRTTSFLLLLVLSLGLCSWVLREKETTLSSPYSEPKNSLDVLIVGSSHVNSGYIPNILWENNNASACNVFSWSQPMWISYHYIKEILRKQNPQVVVLDLFGMMYGHSYIMPEEIDKTSYANSFQMDASINFFEMVATVERCGIDLRQYEDFLNLPRYHTRWKEFGPEMFQYNPHQDKDALKGYGFGFASEEFSFVPAEEAPAQEPYTYCVEYLEKIVALCKTKNIQLIFTLTPYMYGEQEPGLYAWLNQYAQEKEIPFFNYNAEDGVRIGFDAKKDLQDNGHTNFYGAQKLTEDLSLYLQNNYTFGAKEEHSNHEQLDDDYRVYQRILEVQNILVEADLDTFLQMVKEDPKLSVFAVTSGKSAKVESCLRALWPNGQEAPQEIQSMAWQPSVLPAYNQTQISFPLFGTEGTVQLDLEKGEISLNGTLAPTHGNVLTVVLYDHVLERPLDVAVVNAENDAYVHHREFTTDILPNYKKQ